MTIFIMLLVSGLFLSAGAMLAPLWDTEEPRIGITAGLCLAIVISGTVFLNTIFGYSTLNTDYLIFGLMSLVVLSGAASFRENQAGELVDTDEKAKHQQDAIHQQWMSWWHFALLLMCGGGFILLAQYQPINGIPFSLADYQPTAPYDYLIEYIREQLNTVYIRVIQGAAAAISFLLLWSVYDVLRAWGIRDFKLLVILAMIFAIQMLSFTAYGLDYILLLALCSGFYLLRTLQYHNWLDRIAAGLVGGSLVLASGSGWVVGLLCLLFLLIVYWNRSSFDWHAVVIDIIAMAGIMLAGLLPILLWG